eukprot:jgi/Galph1/3773/GphlegSOOS_G2399.1
MFRVPQLESKTVESYVSSTDIATPDASEILKSSSGPNGTQEIFLTENQRENSINTLSVPERVVDWYKLEADKLLSEMRNLSEQLMKAPQDTLSSKELEKLSLCGKAFASFYFLENKNQNTRILVACCLADILRLSAPETPFSDSELKNVFQFFIRQLSSLEHVESPHFPWYFYLLERLASIKAFALVANDEELSVDLLEKCFSIISENHSHKVHLYLSELMASVIEEADQLSQAVLDAALMRLIPPFSYQSPEGFKLAKMLVLRCKDSLQLPISSFLNAVFVDKKTVDSDLRDRVHDLVQQLFQVAPDLLLYVIPGLEAELKVEDVSVRTKSIKLLGRIFISSDSTIFEKYQTLFDEFLNRFYDVDVSIRCEICSLIGSIMEKHPQISQKIEKYLKQRTMDADEKVRELAVETVSSYWQLFSTELLKSITVRLLDKKANVRRAAIRQLTNVFLQEITQQQRETAEESSGSVKMPRTEWIPEELLIAYERLLKEKDEETSLLIEDAIFVDITRALTSKDDLLPFIDTVFSRMETGRKIFESIVAKHRKANKSLSYVLSVLERTENEKSTYISGEASKVSKLEDPAVKEAIKLLAKALPHKKTEEFIVSILRGKSRSIVKDLRGISNLYSSTKEKSSCLESLKKHVRTEIAGFLESCLFCRCSCLLFSKIYVSNLLKETTNNCKHTSSIARMKDRLDFMIIASKHFPESFGDLTRSLEQLLNSCCEVTTANRPRKRATNTRAARSLEGPQLRSLLQALELIFSVAEELQCANEFNLWQLLTDICLKEQINEPDVLKYASGALAKIFGNKYGNPLWKKFLHSLLRHNNLKAAEEHEVVRVFHCFSQFVKHGSVEQIGGIDDIVRFIFEEVLNPLGTTYSDPQVYIAAMKLISNLVIRVEAHFLLPFTPIQILDTFYSILKKHGDIKSQLSNREGAEKTETFGNIRLQCAKSLLKIARKPYIKELMGPFEFLETGLVIQDPLPEVRLAFMQCLCKELLHHRLSFKWFSFFSFAAVEPDKTNYSCATKLASKIIQIRHIYVNQLMTKESGEESDFGHSYFALLPECNLMHLVWFLAHHPDYETDKERDDSSDTKRCLEFFFDRILETRQDHVMFLQQILLSILNAEDATDTAGSTAGTQAIREVANLALIIMKRKQEGKKWNLSEFSGRLTLPASMYKMQSLPEGTVSRTFLFSDDSGQNIRTEEQRDENEVEMARVESVTTRNKQDSPKDVSNVVCSYIAFEDCRPNTRSRQQNSKS